MNLMELQVIFPTRFHNGNVVFVVENIVMSAVNYIKVKSIIILCPYNIYFLTANAWLTCPFKAKISIYLSLNCLNF